MSRWFQVKRFLQYRLHSRTRYGIHSPFIFDLVEKVFRDRKIYPQYEMIESLRKNLWMNHAEIDVEDFGAGSQAIKTTGREISAIARTSAKPKKYAQLLFRLVKYFEAKEILELGTSLGISTSYLAMANPEAKVFTLEGSKSIAEVAENNFRELGIKNIQLLRGEFQTSLPQALARISSVDFLFLDGNHRLAPTLFYFNQCLTKANENSVFVIDDIHWSQEMEQAWKQIQQHPRMTMTIDLFSFGLVFFREGLGRRNEIVRF